MGKVFNRYRDNKKRKKLRSEVPKSEIILWNELQGKRICGLKFRRQYGVGPFVVDFYCPKLKLAIEIDGASHFEEGAEEYDKNRQQFIERFNIKFLRFADNDVYENLEGVVTAIIYETNKMRKIRSFSPSYKPTCK